MQEPVDRYEHKVLEAESITLTGMLLFGFSAACLFEFDGDVFVDSVASAWIFSVAINWAILLSAIATVVSSAFTIGTRRMMFKLGKRLHSTALDEFKRATYHLRHFINWCVIVACLLFSCTWR